MKDPAFLFYSSDFLIGTALLSDVEVGQYIKILCYMHQHKGKLCPADLKHLFPNVTEKLLEKFKRDEYGCYYHARLLKEMDKRKNFTESRRNSLSIDNSDSVHIYLMYDSFSENYKIGSSKYPKLRLKEMNKKNANISIYWYSENLVTRSTEKELHQEFKGLKIHNDWFKLSEKDLTNIKNKSIFHRTDKRTENENENEISISSFEKSEKLLAEEPIVPEMAKEFKKIFPKYPVNEVKDFTACYDIAKMIGEEKNLNSVQILSEGREYVLKRWSEIIQFIKTDKWYSTRSLADISKEWQRLIQTINSNGTNRKTNSNGTVFDRP